MNFEQLIAELNQRKITLWIEDDGTLHSVGPPDSFSESLEVCIKRHESALKDMVLSKHILANDGLSLGQRAAIKIIETMLPIWQAAAQQKEHS